MQEGEGGRKREKRMACYLSDGILRQHVGCFPTLLTGGALTPASLVAGVSEAATVHQEHSPQNDGCWTLGMRTALVTVAHLLPFL